MIIFRRVETDWIGKSVFIVGGGPSLSNYSFSDLDPYRDGNIVLGVNDSAFIPDVGADAFFTLDYQYQRRRMMSIVRFGGEKYAAIPSHFSSDHRILHMHYLKRVHLRGGGFAEETGYGIESSGPSGFGAMNLAYLKGAKRIFLLGFDLNPEPKEQHWHRGYDWRNNSHENSKYENWARWFETACFQLRQRGIHVYNCNPDSRIVCFPKITLQQIGDYV